MGSLSIDIGEIEGGHIEYRLFSEGKINDYLRKDRLLVNYSMNLEEVPRSILFVAPVANFAPLTWLTNTDLFVPELDKTFSETLEDLRSAFDQQISELDFSKDGEVQPQRVVENCYEVDKDVVLFTGGIDSTIAYYDNPNSILATLANGQYTDEEWEAKKAYVSRFAERHDTECYKIDSSVKTIIDYDLLRARYRFGENVSWWGWIQFLTAYPTLCAPISYLNNVGHHILGSGHESHKFKDKFVGNLSWASADCRIDRKGGTRQNKMNRLANIAQETNREYDIRHRYVCNPVIEESSCNKCIRTFAGYVAAGGDPNDVGYKYKYDYVNKTQQLLNRYYGKRVSRDEGEMINDIRNEFIKRIDLDDVEKNELEEIKFAEYSNYNKVYKEKLLERLPEPTDKQILRIYRRIFE